MENVHNPLDFHALQNIRDGNVCSSAGTSITVKGSDTQRMYVANPALY